MKSMVVLLSIVALAVFLGLGVNFASAAGAGKEKTGDMGATYSREQCDSWFKSADADKSGNLSTSEFNKDEFVGGMGREADRGTEGLFSSADKDRDGNLTKNEYCIWRAGHPS